MEARKHKLGVIPDLLLGPEKRLVDIKTVCAKKYYRSGLIRGAAGSGEGRRKRKREDSPRQTPLTKTYGSPVDERALTVHREYFAKAVECTQASVPPGRDRLAHRLVRFPLRLLLLLVRITGLLNTEGNKGFDDRALVAPDASSARI